MARQQEGSPRGSPPPNDPLSALQPSAFPTNPDDFNTDPRVAYSQLNKAWLLEDDGGAEWVWDVAAKKWIPSQAQKLVQKQQEAYAAAADDDNNDAQNAPPMKKRKSNDDHADGSKKYKKGAKSQERANTAIYVSNLPKDATESEVHALFSRYGVISQEIDSGRDRVKLYRDSEGAVNGDALVVYFRPESVQLAITMLDDSDFRPGAPAPEGRIGVKIADASYKRHAAPEGKTEQVGEDKDGEEKVKKKPAKTVDQQKIIERTQELNRRLADWSSDEDDPAPAQPTNTKPSKSVILKHMFTLSELAADPAAVLDITEDVRDECAKHGDVTKLVVYDAEPDGVVLVRFAEPEAAQKVVEEMDGRWFGGERVSAAFATGKEKYRKSGREGNAEGFKGFDEQIQSAQDKE